MAITMLDPCMGSGHFLVFALPIIARLRMEEERLSAQEAITAALRDNIHGLELDPRCTQIGAFNVALTAWKLAPEGIDRQQIETQLRKLDAEPPR